MLSATSSPPSYISKAGGLALQYMYRQLFALAQPIPFHSPLDFSIDGEDVRQDYLDITRQIPLVLCLST